MKYLAPGRAPLITSNISSRMPSAIRTSLSVTGQATPDISVSVSSGAAKETPGIRKTMMLQIASGIRSSGKPIIDIGQGLFFKQESQGGSGPGGRRKSVLSHQLERIRAQIIFAESAL